MKVSGSKETAVAPVALESADDAAIGCEGEALRRDRRTGNVAAEMLETLELAGGHEHLGVQGEAVVVGAQRSRQRRRARRAALA